MSLNIFCFEKVEGIGIFNTRTLELSLAPDACRIKAREEAQKLADTLSRTITILDYDRILDTVKPSGL